MLPMEENMRRTYISENALLPGQVHTYFTGNEEAVVAGIKAELDYLSNPDKLANGKSEYECHCF